MKKITIISSHLYYGGIEKYISYLCKMFENDFKVEVLTVYKKDNKPVFDFSDKVKITYLTDDFPYNISIKKIIKEKKYKIVIKEIFRRVFLKLESDYNLKKAIKNLKSDYVITTRYKHNKIVNKYLKNSSIIKIATEHNYHNNDNKYIKNVVNSVTNYDYFIHCTKELFNFYNPLIKKAESILIENPIHINNNKKSKLNNTNMVSVGRLSYEKGFDDLIRMMKILIKLNPKINLTICGDGAERESLEKQIKEENLSKSVKLTGFLDSKSLPLEYEKASLYVLPSRSEAFGLVLLEAMHYGLPCIAFDSASGARHLLKNNNGILIKNRNLNKMAEEIDNILKDKDKLKEYSKKSIKLVSKYNLNVTYAKWKEILK